jgi:hypothetical protein
MRVSGIPLGVLGTQSKTLIALDFNNGYTDDSEFNHVFTPFGFPPITGGNLVLNGSSNIFTPDSASYDTPITEGDFTIEARVLLTTLNTFSYILNKAISGNQPYGFFFDATNYLRFLAYGAAENGIYVNLSSAAALIAITDSNFHHVAVSRKGSVFKLFLDGNLVDSVTNTTIGNLINNTANLTVGSQTQDATGTYNFKGEIDWLRISRIALYTTNFTPPVSI